MLTSSGHWKGSARWRATGLCIPAARFGWAGHFWARHAIDRRFYFISRHAFYRRVITILRHANRQWVSYRLRRAFVLRVSTGKRRACIGRFVFELSARYKTSDYFFLPARFHHRVFIHHRLARGNGSLADFDSLVCDGSLPLVGTLALIDSIEVVGTLKRSCPFPFPARCFTIGSIVRLGTLVPVRVYYGYGSLPPHGSLLKDGSLIQFALSSASARYLCLGYPICRRLAC